jgi:hypothetical protein
MDPPTAESSFGVKRPSSPLDSSFAKRDKFILSKDELTLALFAT